MRADRVVPLEAEDLDLLATSASMLGREEDYLQALERGYQARLDAGETERAVRCAFWIGVSLARRGEIGRAGGWLGRAQRLLEQEQRDCVEHGYLLIPAMFQQAAAGDWEAATATAARVARIAERFGDQDLLALVGHEQGRILIRQGRVPQGLALLDEAMVAATAGELSPIVTGIVYCGVILACQEAWELRRAQEWTAALTTWCEQQPEMVAFTGRCLLHRAEVMQVRGAWREALHEARRAVERSAQSSNHAAAGEACYRQGEVHRLRGQLAAAEESYREASRWGREPQPGLALLRLARGDDEAALSAIRRVAAETTQPSARAGLLPAYVEVMLALGDVEQARSACVELEEIAEGSASAMLDATAASARGSVELAADAVPAALVALRRAWQAWQELEVPYEAARARVLVGLACRALGDEEAAGLELEAARSTFEQLGAAPEVARVDALTTRAGPADAHRLTPRELEVLRLVAAGQSNREIAAALVISEHTVARHLQNMFAKLGVSSRTAAGAYAFEHGLV
ncbi:MAG TPA: LuxR C-terminal-related transcriptional regulator [Candidatus Limnocylindria bacterium]|nr:LuxR C-terminal-related transcriptional regulator [Candidatus Limnocylindria bacterium]